MLYILFSADYELFMGKNYLSEKEIMLDPSSKLLNLCSQHNIPMTLFCDYLCLEWFRDKGDERFPKLVESQLQDAIRSGHDVQTHLHPHWPFTEKIKDNFSYPLKTFLLGAQSSSEKECYDLAFKYLKSSKLFFEELLKPIIPDYECIAYRAGGYGIQPFTDAIFQALLDTGYCIDSSVVPGMFSRNHVNSIDFRAFDSKSSNISLKSGASIFEIPLASAKLSLKDRLSLYPNFSNIFFNRLRKVLKTSSRSGRKPRGAPIQISRTETPGMLSKSFNRLLQPLKTNWMQLELSPSLKLMQKVTLNYLKEVSEEEDVFFSFSCHPKAMHQEHFLALDHYCSWIKNHFKGKIKAIHYQDAKKLLNKKSSLASKEMPYVGRT
ncbi:Uncharacterized protein AB751O23_BI_00040 [Chlamydiales bacterium SCGC AB-751-O23]|jgi:hypothetical protein|nr:Uncharacterized protein AB751O23_BI_00040 [Chlamydiales bacterium SCGC AB-751-O23]